MAVDPETGLVSWAPSAGDIGSHPVVLRVEDGRGGSGEQHYVLSVADAPPNRPPVFTSAPVVEAHVGSEYLDAARAEDADQDPLEFSLSGFCSRPAPRVRLVHEEQRLSWSGPLSALTAADEQRLRLTFLFE